MSSSVLPKACRNCRVRKIRCDKKYPCSSCQTSGIECRQSSNSASVSNIAPFSSPQPAATGNIDVRGLSQSIEQINIAVQQLLTLQRKQPGGNIASDRQGAHGSYTVEQSDLHESDAEVHEGVSSFNSQALVAGEASQALAGGHTQLLAAQEGLRSLRELVSDGSPSTDGASPRSHPSSQTSIAKNLQLLPIDVVLQVVKVFKVHMSSVILPFGLPTLEYLEASCRAAYFPTEPLLPGQLAVMHGMLWYLLWEWKTRDDMPAPNNFEFDHMLKVSEANFEVGLRTYEVLAYASYDNAVTLYIAAIRARESSNVKRSWAHVSCATCHVLNLGLHRRATVAHLPAGQVRDSLLLFWNIYGLEKSMALTLGHTSSFRDDDIDADPIPFNPDLRIRNWDEVINFNARIARIEGKIFDRLYTVSALGKKPEDRAAIVHDLVADLEQTIYTYRPQRSSECIFPDIYDFAYGESGDVSYYSLLTTLHRGTFATRDSPGSITQPCYDAAQKCLKAHLGIIEKVRNYRGGQLTQAYLTWALQYGAFTPLIVVFLHAISNLDEHDLDLLQRFHASLNEIQNSTEGTRKLLSICAIFISVAKAYVESRPDISINAASTTAQQPPSAAEIVRRQDIQQAFGRPQVMNNNANNHGFSGADQQNFSWEGFDDAQIDEMSTFMDNWMDGSQQAADLFSVDFGAPHM
ncbi:hypothetical protein Slin15195_G119260 [Septoria linicola]|uniref:Zn(2)-C6 fungal-type domain-containing protein n=1 Tax=Septoria linicola TaxID=215465 RepID=A0A9Q9EQB1_9PEZI|nr:hypothetical protein Slin15195_G119260 [Septoria linicola]